jgi:hypothetical protein
MGFLESRHEDHCDTEESEKIDQNFSNNINNNDKMITYTYKNHDDIVNNYEYSNSATKILYQIIEPNSVDLEVQKASNSSIEIQNTFHHKKNSIEKLNEKNVTKVKSVRKINFTIPATVFLNGCLLGMSWDGLPSLGAALALSTWDLLFLFLGSYCVGTVCTISLAAGFIGESTKWLSTVTSANLPRRLALASSICALIIGFLWILEAITGFLEVNEDEAMHDNNNKTYSFSWFLCSVIALASPVAIVGIVVLTITSQKHHIKLISNENIEIQNPLTV